MDSVIILFRILYSAQTYKKKENIIMNNVTLVIIPGPGARSVSLAEGATLSDLICQENLHGRDIIVNGSGVPADSYADTVIPTGAEIFATGSVKGNVDQITLVVIPGPGARSISVTPGMSLSDLVCQENLHGRDIIVNGSGVPTNDWANTPVLSGSEIFATGSVKGNTNA